MLGLLLVDHGSRRNDANAALADMARRVARRRPDALVGHAHMELADPGIPAGIADLVARGATRLIVLPYFLTIGRHAVEDVPRLVADAAARHGIPARCGGVLGPHDALADLLLERAGLAAEGAR